MRPLAWDKSGRSPCHRVLFRHLRRVFIGAACGFCSSYLGSPSVRPTGVLGRRRGSSGVGPPDWRWRRVGGRAAEFQRILQPGATITLGSSSGLEVNSNVALLIFVQALGAASPAGLVRLIFGGNVHRALAASRHVARPHLNRKLLTLQP